MDRASHANVDTIGPDPAPAFSVAARLSSEMADTRIQFRSAAFPDGSIRQDPLATMSATDSLIPTGSGSLPRSYCTQTVTPNAKGRPTKRCPALFGRAQVHTLLSRRAPMLKARPPRPISIGPPLRSLSNCEGFGSRCRPPIPSPNLRSPSIRSKRIRPWQGAVLPAP